MQNIFLFFYLSLLISSCSRSSRVDFNARFNKTQNDSIINLSLVVYNNSKDDIYFKSVDFNNFTIQPELNFIKVTDLAIVDVVDVSLTPSPPFETTILKDIDYYSFLYRCFIQEIITINPKEYIDEQTLELLCDSMFICNNYSIIEWLDSVFILESRDSITLNLGYVKKNSMISENYKLKLNSDITSANNREYYTKKLHNITLKLPVFLNLNSCAFVKLEMSEVELEVEMESNAY
jgi:hypothetical protein